MSEQTFNERVAAWISSERDALNLSRQDVADGVRVTAASVANWEKGVHSLSAYSLKCLKAFFKQKRDALAGLKGEVVGAPR